MKILLPKIYPGKIEDTTPLFFLMGPIKGGNDWQRRACTEIAVCVEDPVIVVPCRWTSDHPLLGYFLDGHALERRQTTWERYFLERASAPGNIGSIIAWLPCEDKQNPRSDGQPYARDTYGELGEWRGRLMNSPSLHFTLGAEDGFPGLDVIKENFRAALGARFKIHSTLEETIKAAVERYC